MNQHETTMGGEYLLLLDLEGTICHPVDGPLSHVKPSFTTRRKQFYVRDGIKEFLDDLRKELFVCFAYTSLNIRTASSFLEEVLKDYPELFETLLGAGRQSRSKTGELWHSIKGLGKDCPPFLTLGIGRTIILYSEECHFKDASDNRITMLEGDELISGSLDALKAYLLKLANDSPDNVSEYISKNPFMNVYSEGNKGSERNRSECNSGCSREESSQTDVEIPDISSNKLDSNSHDIKIPKARPVDFSTQIGKEQKELRDGTEAEPYIAEKREHVVAEKNEHEKEHSITSSNETATADESDAKKVNRNEHKNDQDLRNGGASAAVDFGEVMKVLNDLSVSKESPSDMKNKIKELVIRGIRTTSEEVNPMHSAPEGHAVKETHCPGS